MTYIKETHDQLQGRMARAGTPSPPPMYIPKTIINNAPPPDRSWVDDLLARAYMHSVESVYRQTTPAGEVRVVLIGYHPTQGDIRHALVTVDCPGMALMVWSHGPAVHDYEGACAWVAKEYGPPQAPQPGQRREVK